MWVSYYATLISKNECLTPLGKMKTLIGLKKMKSISLPTILSTLKQKQNTL